MLPLTAVTGGKSLGHDLGYLLWGLVAVGDFQKAAVYDALVNGPSVGCWGTYNEAYDADAVPNANGLRSFETGVNISAIARYWGLGERRAPDLAPATPLILPPGTWVPIDDNHSAITYSGSWNYSTTSQGYYLTTCHFSNQAGSYAQFTFDGTGIRWIGGKNNDHGDAEVYIDGALQAGVNTHAASWLTRQLLYEKKGLPNGRHTIRIAVKGGGNQDVDAFVYCTGEPLP